MRLITISMSPERVRKQRRIWPELEVFEATGGCDWDYRDVCIPITYHRLAAWAVDEQLGRETVVMQDDVWMPNGPGLADYIASFDSPLVVFGTTERSGLIVPKAFSAEPFIWELLSQAWTGEGRIGPAWRPIVDEYGLVLNVTREL